MVTAAVAVFIGSLGLAQELGAARGSDQPPVGRAHDHTLTMCILYQLS